MSLVEVENLEHSYFRDDTEAPKALSGVSFRLEAGEYLAVVGANGSGKSTLALHLNALLIPTAGRIRIGGLDTAQPQSWPRVRQTAAMVFQRPEEQIVALTVEEDAAFGPENAALAQSEIRARVTESLARVGLEGFEARSPHKLSAGQKQRLAIAGVLALRPRLIVFDEATSMLDPAGRREVLSLMDELNGSGVAIVHITHNMEEAARAGRLLAMQEGRIEFDGPPHAFFEGDSPAVRLLGRPPALEIALELRRQAAIDLGAPLSFHDLETAIDRATLRGGISGRSPARRNGNGTPPGEVTGGDGGETVLRIEELSHSYLRGRRTGANGPGYSLSGVNLALRRGECVALVGPTGSGKSTLLQHANALVIPQTGRVELFGREVKEGERGLAALRRRAGLVFQRPEEQIFAEYVGDEVAYGPRLAGMEGKALTERVRWALETVGLEFARYRDRPTFALSGGEQRKVGIAGVLALRPELLLLDEPGAGLDPSARGEMADLIRRLKGEGTTILLSTHDMDEVLALSDRVVVLEAGRVRLAGRPEEVFLEEATLNGLGLEVPGPFAIARRLCPEAGAEELPTDLREAVGFLSRVFTAPTGAGGQHGGER